MRITLLTLVSILALLGCEELASTPAPAPEPPQPVDGPECGNRFIDVNEQCDDGNDIEDDGCTTECRHTCQPWPGYRNPCVPDADRIQSCFDHAACQHGVNVANADRALARCLAGDGPWAAEAQCRAGHEADLTAARNHRAASEALCRNPC